jgi:hypothetical protein
MKRSLFTVDVRLVLDYPIRDEDDYNDEANMMASAMHDVLATRESLDIITN